MGSKIRHPANASKHFTVNFSNEVDSLDMWPCDTVHIVRLGATFRLNGDDSYTLVSEQKELRTA